MGSQWAGAHALRTCFSLGTTSSWLVAFTMAMSRSCARSASASGARESTRCAHSKRSLKKNQRSRDWRVAPQRDLVLGDISISGRQFLGARTGEARLVLLAPGRARHGYLRGAEGSGAGSLNQSHAVLMGGRSGHHDI